MFKTFHIDNWNLKFYLLVFGFFLGINLLGPKGLVHWMLTKQEFYRSKNIHQSLKTDLSVLEYEVSLLRHSSEYQEKMLRENLGLLRENELSLEFYGNQNP